MTNNHNFSYNSIEQAAKNIRLTILDMVFNAKASHIASAFSSVEILATIYFQKSLELNACKDISQRDSVVLSKGHACTALYSTLYHFNLMDRSLIDTYGMDGSPLMHHISHKAPNVDFSTGSLGHGLPFTVGLCLSDAISKLDNKRFCILGDGEMAEGSNWEAMLFASHNNLSNLCIIIDYNNLQSLDTVENTLSLHPLSEKLKSFGMNVIELDGHNCAELQSAINHESEIKPTAIIANTVKGKGVSFMENSVVWHYKNPNDEEYEAAKKEIMSDA